MSTGPLEDRPVRYYRARITTSVHLDIDGGEPREIVTRHEVYRADNGDWTVKVFQPGRATEMHGTGTVPALIVTDGITIACVPGAAGQPPGTPLGANESPTPDHR